MTSRKRRHKPDDDSSQAAVGETGSTQPQDTSRKKPPRPSQCRDYTREAVAESLPTIIKTFVSEAKSGSVPHFNHLAKFGGFDLRPIPASVKRKGKSLAQSLLEDMKEHEAKMIAADEARLAAKLATE
jgi:hypothetical protein